MAVTAADKQNAKTGASAIREVPISDLIPYANNARTHSDAQVASIAGSIREFGFNNPVLVDGDSGIIAGHGRVLAARKLGLGTVPVIELTRLSEAQKRAYIVADNRLAEQAVWDGDLLSLELADPKEERTPEPPVNPVSQLGDLWLLGKHRLMCGDATDEAAIKLLLDGVTPHLMVTDPPYSVMYDPDWRNRAGASETRRTGKVNDDRADWRAAWALFPGDVAYVWHGALHATTVADSLISSGFDIRSQIIWAKDRLVLSRGHYHWQHEPCWYAMRGKGHWSGGSHADDAVDDPEPRLGCHHGPRNAKTGRVYAAPDAEQRQRLTGGLRAVLGIGDDDYCGRELRAGLPRDGAGSGLCGCGGAALAGLHDPFAADNPWCA